MSIPALLKFVKPELESPKVFSLRKPVKFAGGTLTEITLREPTAAQVVGSATLLQDASRDGQTSWLQNIVASVGKISPVGALDDVPYSDLMAMGLYLGEFISACFRDDNAEPVSLADIDPVWEMSLQEPIEIGGLAYTTVSLSEPTISQLKKAQAQLRRGVSELTYRNYQMHLVANVSGLPLAVVAAFPISTLNAAASYLSVFTVPGRATT